MKSSLLNYKTFTYTILVVLLIYVFYICFVSKKNILSNLNSHKEGFSFRMFRHIKNKHPQTTSSGLKMTDLNSTRNFQTGQSQHL